MIIRLVTALLFFAGCAPAFAQKFVGRLELIPAGCEQMLKCTLKSEFGFIDSEGTGWQARAGLETDGASIPDWAQPFVGGQFDKEFVRAAVIHDHYCDRHVRSWRKTHWVFYDALLASGVDNAKAALMYFAVYLGGPKWVELVPGRACKTGRNCIQNLPRQSWPAETTVVTPGGTSNNVLVRPAKYSDPDFKGHLVDAEKYIAAKKGRVTLAELRQRAESIRIGDFYYREGESITVVPAPGIDR